MHKCSNLNELLPSNLCRSTCIQRAITSTRTVWTQREEHVIEKCPMCEKKWSVSPVLRTSDTVSFHHSLNWCHQMVKLWLKSACSCHNVYKVSQSLDPLSSLHTNKEDMPKIATKTICPLCQWFDNSLRNSWSRHLTLSDKRMKCTKPFAFWFLSF